MGYRRKREVILVFVWAVVEISVPWSQGFFLKRRESREDESRSGEKRKTSGYLGLESHFHAEDHLNFSFVYDLHFESLTFILRGSAGYEVIDNQRGCGAEAVIINLYPATSSRIIVLLKAPGSTILACIVD